jgi:hypothetical protein
MPKIVDLNSEVSCMELQQSADKTTTFTTGYIDLLGYEGDLKITLDIGTVSGTSPTLDVKIQDSADHSSFADLSPAWAFAQQNASAVVHKGLDVRSCRRYIQAVCTIGGTTPHFNMCLLAYGQKQTL